MNVKEPVFETREYLITDFGAKPEINFDNQLYIQNAIDLCSKEGGGKVIIPQGYWLTSPIQLKSNVCLHAMNGAFVKFTKIKEKYPLRYTNYEGRKAIRALSPISAVNAVNVAITGKGIFDGNGEQWRPKKDWKMPAFEWQVKKNSEFIAKTDDGLLWFPTETAYLGYINNVDEKLPNALEEASKYYDWYRPVFVSFISCENVLLRNATFTNSPNWTIHLLFCKNITVDGCHAKNTKEAQNSDGIDVDSCENVVIKNCIFDVGDDAICMKAGKGREARQIVAPTKNVEIYDCKVYRGHGGFVIGSETSRGIENVYVHDCSFISTDTGIRVKSALGRGGYVRNITVENIIMSRISGDCITFSMSYDAKSLLDMADNITEYYEDDIPVISGFNISKIICDSAKRFIYINGLDVSPVRDIVLSDCNVISETDTEICNAENVIFNNVIAGGKLM